MKKIHCTVCRQLLSERYLVVNSQHIYFHCTHCGLVQLVHFSHTKTRVSYAAFDAAECLQNSSSIYRILKFLRIGNFLNNFYVQSVYEKRKRLIECYKKGGRVLDIGCANGTLLGHFSDSWRRVGIDPNTTQIREGKKLFSKIELHAQTLAQFRTKAKFDVVMLWHVFEHLENPQRQLSLIKKILKKDGVLVIEVPTTSFFFHLFRRDWQLLMYPEHLFFYSARSLKLLLEKHGFKGIKVRYEGILSTGAPSLIRLLQRKGVPSNIAMVAGLLFLPVASFWMFLSPTGKDNLSIISIKK